MTSTPDQGPTTPLVVVCLLTALFLLPACSLVSDRKGPERGIGYNVLPEPVAQCGDPIFLPNCGLIYEGTLTARSTFTIGVATEALRLVFDDTLQTFDLIGNTQVTVPLEVGRHYRVVVELVPTVILGHGSFEVTDAEGLVFFSTLEIEAGWERNPPPPEGWRVSMEEGGYDSHGLGCGARSTPQVLVVEHEGERVRLVQGEAKRVGDYLITALTAEEVDYSDVDCLDYFAAELSYTIARAVN